MAEKLLVCTVGGRPYYGSQMEYDLVRMVEGDGVRYTISRNGKRGVGWFRFSSIMTGELHAEIDAADGSRVAVFPGCHDTIEKV